MAGLSAVSEKTRCSWPGEDPLYLAYHDNEWGVPEYDPRALYENFRKAFHNFDPEKIARYGKRDVERLLKNEGIIRSRAKIEAAIRGARLWLEIEEKEAGGFTELIWKHVDGKPKRNRFKPGQIPAQTDMSEGLARELKTRGFNFCGPVIVYAFAQATGMVNDHVTSCFRHAQCAKLGKP